MGQNPEITPTRSSLENVKTVYLGAAMLIELSEKDKKKAARQEEADYKEHVIGCLEELCDEVIEHGLSSERVADIIDFRRDEVHAEDWKKCLRTARGKKLPRAVVDPLLERLCA